MRENVFDFVGKEEFLALKMAGLDDGVGGGRGGICSLLFFFFFRSMENCALGFDLLHYFWYGVFDKIFNKIARFNVM